MIHKQLIRMAIATLTIGILATAQAQQAVRFAAQPAGSKVKIDGTSTVHDWTVEGGLIGGYFEVPEAFLKNPAAKEPSVKPTVDVKIPVRSLKSGKKPMDSIMYDAMKMAQHPTILYTLREMTFKEGAGPWVYTAKGWVTVAGVRKNVEFPVTMQRVGDDKLKFTAITNVKMTDFGISPPAPSLALGLIKTGDDVKLTLEWMTARAAAAP